MLVLPTLLLGGKLTEVLIAQAIAAALVAGVVWRASRSVGVGPLSVDRSSLKVLFTTGASLLVVSFAMTLQPNVDALFMSKLATAEVVGWHAAAQRLMSVLMLPASALITALYPTLARLHSESIEQYTSTTRRALHGTTHFAIPMALCCALYRDAGIQIFSERHFGPAAGNLLVMSLLVFLLYFSMPLGTAILAAGLQRRFAAVQSLCVLVSLALDPLLIPWFQDRYGNGGLGVCVAGVVSEILMVGAAIAMAPKGIVDRSLFVVLGKGAIAGLAMSAVAYVLRDVTPFASAPVAVAAYGGCLWLIGGVDRGDLEILRNVVVRKFRRQQV
jgi:O-antigen/teichoic acid export membrane protein